MQNITKIEIANDKTASGVSLDTSSCLKFKNVRAMLAIVFIICTLACGGIFEFVSKLVSIGGFFDILLRYVPTLAVQMLVIFIDFTIFALWVFPLLLGAYAYALNTVKTL